MGKGILIALSNPTAGADESEFNRWYNEVHSRDLLGLKGFASMTRFKAAAQALPPGGEPAFKYLALLELDDVDEALKALAEGAKNFSMSDTVNMAGATAIAYTKIYSSED